MLTLLSTLIGFIASLAPELFKFFGRKQDNAHEIAVLEKQIEAQKAIGQQRIEEVRVTAESAEAVALYHHASRPTGSKWFDMLNASVRPIITYAFFLLFCGVKIHQMMTVGAVVWDDETAALFGATLGFWFGHRSLKKK